MADWLDLRLTSWLHNSLDSRMAVWLSGGLFGWLAKPLNVRLTLSWLTLFLTNIAW